MCKSKTEDAENCIEASYDWWIIAYLLLVKNSFFFVHLLVTEKLSVGKGSLPLVTSSSFYILTLRSGNGYKWQKKITNDNEWKDCV
jgi:hypothetical protein